MNCLTGIFFTIGYGVCPALYQSAESHETSTSCHSPLLV
jgi:hypothetical protein